MSKTEKINASRIDTCRGKEPNRMFIELNVRSGLHRYSAKRNLHQVNFFCDAPQAKCVSVVGDFNDWRPDATPMIRQSEGRWTARVELSHGHHQYLFLVDGQLVLDPKATGKARNDHNEPVSLLAVS